MTIQEIRNRKKELHWTNEELAKAAGIPVSTVAKILSGATKRPHRDSMAAIERAIAQHNGKNTENVPETSGTVGVSSDGHFHHTMPYGEGGGAAFSGYAGAHFVAEPTYSYGTEAKQLPFGHQPGGYTVDDYLALPRDRRVELIDGRFYDMAAPTITHQQILFHIWKTVDSCIEDHHSDCVVVGAPYDVQLFNDPYTVVQPDVMIFCGRTYQSLEQRAKFAPDFVAEILSPSTAFRDRTQKLCRYRDAGVKEVWIVSPKKQKIYVYRFDMGKEDPDEYDFHDSVPLGISDKRCAVDFSKMLKYVSHE